MADVHRNLAVLMIEDSERDALLILDQIESSGYHAISERIETAEELTETLVRTRWDVVLSDYSLPAFDTAEALALIQRSGNDLPFIIVSGAIGEEAAVALMKAGAHDYVMKTHLARLVPAIEREMAEAQTRRERSAAEESIRLSLKEKELLLKEIHHRVKNNLQVICSILHLQQDKIHDTEMVHLFLETQHRVRSMALVHDKLYQSPSLATIDFNDYVQSLSTELLRTFWKPGVSMAIDIADISFGVDTAVPCGLIVNELLTNSLKHGFPDERPGQIQIGLHHDPHGDYTLTVRDNGVGFPPGYDMHKATSMGTQVICSLVDQLDGTSETTNQEGALTTIRFPLPPHD
jgi:two-component sensor histidine kinase